MTMIDYENEKDVTVFVDYGLNDDELLPLKQCVCGEKFTLWDMMLSIDSYTECPHCHRQLRFGVSISVYSLNEQLPNITGDKNETTHN